MSKGTKYSLQNSYGDLLKFFFHLFSPAHMWDCCFVLHVGLLKNFKLFDIRKLVLHICAL